MNAHLPDKSPLTYTNKINRTIMCKRRSASHQTHFSYPRRKRDLYSAVNPYDDLLNNGQYNDSTLRTALALAGPKDRAQRSLKSSTSTRRRARPQSARMDGRPTNGQRANGSVPTFKTTQNFGRIATRPSSAQQIHRSGIFSGAHGTSKYTTLIFCSCVAR